MVRVLGISGQEASRRLGSGDAGFILEAKLPAKLSDSLSLLRPLRQVHPQADYFSAILIENSGHADSAAISTLLYILALENQSAVIRREAGKKLLQVIIRSDEIFIRELLDLRGNPAAADDTGHLWNMCLYRVKHYGEVIRNLENGKNRSSWNMALYLLSRLNEGLRKNEPVRGNEAFRKDVLSFMLESPVDQAWQWAMNEFRMADEVFFSLVERAAIAGRAATARSQFGESLVHFRICLSDGIPVQDENAASGPSNGEKLFFKYPELIRDAGRAFQFAAGSGNEGIRLFSDWEEQIRRNSAGTEVNPQVFFMVPYFLGRIYRQYDQIPKSTEAFVRAVGYAPDSVQADACIWYILTNTLREKPETAAAQIIKYIPLMHSLQYFDDVLDRYSQYAVKNRKWRELEDILTMLTNQKTGGANAQYSWILGRAVEEKYYSARTETDFFGNINEDDKAHLYYRALAAQKTGTTLIPEKALPEENKKNRQELEFLLGFFDFNSAARAIPVIREYENMLTAGELRMLAGELEKAGRTDASLNIVTRYMARENYEICRDDLYLCYPRPFKDLAEKYAAESGIGPELLFALIRTESYFNPAAVSRAGATGLSQLMRETALDMANRIARRYGPDYDYRTENGIDLKNPEISIHIGGYYLNYLIDNLGSPMTAVFAYNGGMGRVRRWRAAEPELPEDLFLESIEYEETREHGRRVAAAAAVYGYLYYEMNMDEVIADIFR